MASPNWIQLGDFRALVSPAFDTPGLREALANLPTLLAGPDTHVLQAGRHVTSRLSVTADGRSLDLVIKRFGQQSAFKNFWDRFHGTKAHRTFLAANYMRHHGIGTVKPVACLERWQGLRLCDSCFVSLYLADTVSFKDRLAEVWRQSTDGSDFLPLLELVADGIRRLHDSGCTHGDLGNQNIELVKSEGSFSGIAFLDLNRARFGRRLSIGERADDLARISLPYGLLGDFFRIYWRGKVPTAFMRAYRLRRFLFKLHGTTRRIRHPLRERHYRLHPEIAPPRVGYPRLFTVTDNMPDGHYTDSRGRRLTRDEAAVMPNGTRIYRF